MQESDDSGDPLPPIDGNVLGLENERHRLSLLAEVHDDSGPVIKKADPAGWRGRANEQYGETRDALAKHYQRVADPHHAVAEKLDSYRSTLEDIQRLRKSIVADVRANPDPDVIAAARASIERWQQQLASAGQSAARKINDATGDLATLRRLLPDHDPAPPIPSIPIAPRLTPARPAALPGPHDMRRDPAAYRQHVTEVSDAAFHASRLP